MDDLSFRRAVTICDVAGIVGKILPKAFTPSNIHASFKKTKISPVDSDHFKGKDLLSSYVTERYYEAKEDISVHVDVKSNDNSERLQICLGPQHSSSKQVDKVKDFLSPAQVRPYPKAEPRKNTRKGRARLKSTILTSSSFMEGKIQKARETRTKEKGC